MAGRWERPSDVQEFKSNKTQSYGVIPLRFENGKLHVFLIRVKHTRKTTWEFPKGKGEARESAHMTAKRELTEETGLVVERFLTQKGIEEKYSFLVKDVGRVYKTVIYFPALVSGTPVLQSAENIVAGRWMTFEDAKQCVYNKDVLRTIEDLF